MKTQHRLSDVDIDARTASCSTCGPGAAVRPRADRGAWRCLEIDRASDRRRRARGPRPTEPHAKRILRKFGITADEYEQLMQRQGGACAICLMPPPADRRLAVDHCHESGDVRGLLCTPCNAALGMFRDDPTLLARAMQYLTNA